MKELSSETSQQGKKKKKSIGGEERQMLGLSTVHLKNKIDD